MNVTNIPAAVGLGLAAGVIHVMTGADHISAVATLACGKSKAV